LNEDIEIEEINTNNKILSLHLKYRNVNTNDVVRIVKSSKTLQLIDSLHAVTRQLEDVEFSIDSLSKIK
jgi:hypothetical protein